MNTRVEYLYRDGSNYKQWGAVVFRGGCDARWVQRLFAALDSGELFIAHQVRVPELFFTERPLYADNHCWHEMAEVTSTSAAADDPMERTIEEFVAEMERAARDGWAVFDRSERLLGRSEGRASGEVQINKVA
jgi:hypothetical protein